MLKTFQARAQTGYLYASDVPKWATALLLGGWDSPALREIAGLQNPTQAEVGLLTERALQQLGAPTMPVEEAYRWVIRDVAEQLLAGEIEPYAAAAELHGLCQTAGIRSTSPYSGLPSTTMTHQVHGMPWCPRFSRPPTSS